MQYSLAFFFLLLYLLMSYLLPLQAGLAQWDLILEPITHAAMDAYEQHPKLSKKTADKQVLEKLEEVCREQLNLEGHVYLTAQTPLNLDLPDENFEVEWLNVSEELSSQMKFDIRILHDGEVLATKKNWPLKVEHHKLCLCSNHKLFSKMAVVLDDFKCEERDILSCHSCPVSTDLQGAFRLRRNLQKDDILCEDAIERQALIKKGASVDVFMKNGLLKINLKGVALADGCLNEVIKVKNMATNKILQGKIINESSVQIVF